MNKIENTQNVKKIVMHPRANCKCQLGQDWYTIDFDVVFVPNKYYPDYTEVRSFIMNNIDGVEYNIEDAIKVLYDMLQYNYGPTELFVTAKVQNSATHFNVEVTI